MQYSCKCQSLYKYNRISIKWSGMKMKSGSYYLLSWGWDEDDEPQKHCHTSWYETLYYSVGTTGKETSPACQGTLNLSLFQKIVFEYCIIFKNVLIIKENHFQAWFVFYRLEIFLDSNTHDNPRMDSRRKFIVVPKYLYFLAEETIRFWVL